MFVQLLAKLHVPDQLDEDKLRKLMLLLRTLRRVSSPLALWYQ